MRQFFYISHRGKNVDLIFEDIRLEGLNENRSANVLLPIHKLPQPSHLFLEAQVFLQSADPDFIQESAEGVPPLTGVPRDRVDMMEYHVIIFGDVDPGALGDTWEDSQEILSTIKDFVKAGGGFMMQAGELHVEHPDAGRFHPYDVGEGVVFRVLLSREKGAEKIWPYSRYVARYIEEHCTFCGLCSKRCPFDAFLFQRKTKRKKARLSLKTELCRGCGICVTGCPEGAIEMASLKHNGINNRLKIKA